MTEPIDDPIDAWGLIFHGSGLYTPSHSRQEWSQIADAIRTADLNHATRSADNTVPVRGDAVWCEIAADTFTRLHAAGAYWHMRPLDEPHCYADEHLIRGWLDAPWIPPRGHAQTQAEMAGYHDEFEQGRLPDPAVITMLIGAAQDAGVFGIPNHRVNLWRFFGDGTMPEHTFTLTIRPPEGPGISSDLISADELLQVGRDPVAVIVDVLGSVAGVANNLLAAERTTSADTAVLLARADEPPPPLPAGVHGYPLGGAGRPFRPLNSDADPAPAEGGPPCLLSARIAALAPDLTRDHGARHG